jgi:hypothetical protein
MLIAARGRPATFRAVPGIPSSTDRRQSIEQKVQDHALTHRADVADLVDDKLEF